MTDHHSINDHAEESRSKTLLGFWIYLMTDVILFGALFATYAVLKDSTFGGPGGRDLFELPYVLLETFLLLISSYTMGLTVLAAGKAKRSWVLIGLLATFLLGAGFLALELNEFSQLVREGHSWQASAFLSAFFTLVGTHGLHISVGLLWIAVLSWLIIKRGLSGAVIQRLSLLSLFWHFLDVIWIFIFTVVYLMGVM